MNAPADVQEKLRALLHQMALNSGSANGKEPKSMEEHKFWKTQPVVKHDEVVDEDGAIEPDVPLDQVRATPYPLPKEFEWSLVNVEDDKEIKELYELLTLNYVEDDDAMFRFDYSAEFLKWALLPPGWKKSWHIGVRVASNKKLVAFISGIPQDVRVHNNVKRMVEINFLCIHKKLRSKRLAPVLIKEVTRRTHLEGIFQAVYTAGVVLPKPMATCRYFHRSLNPKKLVETGFSQLGRNMTMARLIKLYKMQTQTNTPGLRPMEEKDVKAVSTLMNKYMSHFNLAPHFGEEDVRHWLITRPGVVWGYVVEDPETKEITDFFSFYSLPSTVINHTTHSTLNAAYCFYYAVQIPDEELSKIADVSEREAARDKAIKDRLTGLMQDALILARQNDFDVFNALNLMDNSLFIDDLKFGPGDGYLHFYLYNWRCREVESKKVGLVML
ncbi:glycylpeptide N-tetradecanoyltransferase 2 [Lobosporangium transversale]|uniref:Glycylpeptide N-tetradecanoyltransferase n=1 Tax=Lobosporangium transversale TaxID=64571 RepID=A0A1Y2GRL0_9FUNG|nr:glycylpeptide N-tetradecanoyltransferase 2 [Lobosporangium transversale]ORZ20164.1 glycylpeptide N-tetradecanoyltransferase 2 [Lobosporangium transversale]|eukprot:XP_021882704.1 glycylpeptide N-tetradecanoyltransferase 2 [Lobosporangium transversale]